MVTGGSMREILLHGGADETFDRSVEIARQLAESFGARLHVVYTIEDPLSAGWTAEMSAERLPELHQAMEDGSARAAGRPDPGGGPGAPRRGDRPADRSRRRRARPLHERARHRSRHRPVARAGAPDADVASALLDRGECAVLVLR